MPDCLEQAYISTALGRYAVMMQGREIGILFPTLQTSVWVLGFGIWGLGRAEA